MELKEIKAEARKAATKVRNLAHDVWKDEAPLLLAQHHFPIQLNPDCKVVSAFFPYKIEIDTLPLLGKLAGEGWTTCLPIVVAPRTPLIFRRWMPGQPTIPGVWDIPQPADDAEVVEPDVLLVPMMAFDRRGFRLGYGGGFYDRTLQKLRSNKPITAIGVAYSAQEVDSVPHDSHDQTMDMILTEKGFHKCG